MKRLVLFLIFIVLIVPTLAQDDDDDDGLGAGLREITPGQTIPGYGPTQYTDRELQSNGCFVPLGLEIGQQVYVKSGVNVRNQPSLAGGVVWNTVQSDQDESTPATIEEGPICNNGFNWWRITGIAAGNPGWIAEGRPDNEAGYFILVTVEEDVCDPYYEIAVGKTVELMYNIRVRSIASRQGVTYAVAPAGTMARVISGPICNNSYLWWEVDVVVGNWRYIGWMSEGGGGLFWLVPDDVPSIEDGTLCANPQEFPVGMRGHIRYFDDIPKTLRSSPGVESPQLYRLLDGVPLEILDGPICRNNLNWWKVHVLSIDEVIGWVAEGSPGVGYWIVELDVQEVQPNEVIPGVNTP